MHTQKLQHLVHVCEWHTIPWYLHQTTYFCSSDAYTIKFLFMFDLWCFCCVFLCFISFLKIWNSGRSCWAGISFSWSSTGESYWIYGPKRRLTQGCQLLLCASSGGTVGHYLSLGILWKIIIPFSVYNLVYFLLQDFTPEEGRYDVIWIQWCIGQLPDDDFISFFNRAKVTWLWLH